MTLYEYDEALGVTGFCGVDEAGRGPLAGDVYAGAVILDPAKPIEGLNDSKKLSEKRREALFDEICEKAVSFSVGVATVREIDAYNILNATFLAMRRAVAGLSAIPPMALVDGNRNPGLPVPTRLLVKGDATSASVAAASILAKVSRDRYMKALALEYPEYELARHKGYGTKLHKELLTQYGPSPIHRKSFLKKLKNLPSKSGRRGEAVAVQLLTDGGCRILGSNYAVPEGELDVVAEKGGFVLFVEVKTRRTDGLDTPAAWVTEAKQRRLLRAAARWLEENPVALQPRFDVVEVLLDPKTGAFVSANWLEDAFGQESRAL